MKCWICEREMGVASVTYGSDDHRAWWYCAWCNYRHPEQLTEEESCSATSYVARSSSEIGGAADGAGSLVSALVSTFTMCATGEGMRTTIQGT